MNVYYALAERLGVDVAYDTSVTALTLDDDRCTAVSLSSTTAQETVSAQAFVAATGGFEANFDWLREYWGDRVDSYAVRGSAYNDGSLLRHLLDLGAEPRGNPRGHHAIAVDARSPRYDGGIVTRVDSIPFSIVVNRDGRRFADEGEDLWPMRYATWGELIGEQPGQKVFSIFDSKVVGTFISGAYTPVVADTIPELAKMVGLPEEQVSQTVAEYNDAVTDGHYDPRARDGCGTVDLDPPKSNWALPIDAPPFYCFPLIPGITFTYLALAVDTTARVLRKREGPLENVFAAGEIMAGNILLRGYLAGIGMTIGSVFGIVAGREAAALAA
jgi:tricarballylate dehydrogenase